MNSVLMTAKKLAYLEPRTPLSTAVTRRQPAQDFASYFIEQSIALLGTWLQQVVVGWLTHGASHAQLPMLVNAVSPEVGQALTVVGSALTWLLLTVWTFKLRERFRNFTNALTDVKANVSTIVGFCLLNWARKGHRHCS